MDDCPPMVFQVASSSSKHEMTKGDIRQVVAIAVINRLHEWCIQLFWITILCVMGCCGDEADIKGGQRSSSNGCLKSPAKSQRKNLADIEMKLLRHLTSPNMAKVRPVCRKRRAASRPPSPQLFDIQEEELEC